MVNSKWSRKEVILAKEALKLANGNQTEAAIALSEKLDRSLASIKNRMCILAKLHPSLRKENIARRESKRVVKEETAIVAAAEIIETRIVKSISLTDNTLVITFQ
jgi:hypothetical protein